MMQISGDVTWHVIGESVRGSSHIREDVPKQDAIAWWPETGIGCPIAVAVADGHGSIKHFRSHLGAIFAVESAIHVLTQFSQKAESEENVQKVIERATVRLPNAIHQEWLNLVANHITQNQFTAEEYFAVENDRGTTKKLQIALQPVIAYGSTLLCVLITRSYVIYIQLGDGDILIVDKEDGIVRKAIPRNSNELGDETSSLCVGNAVRDFRVVVEPIDNNPPLIVFLSTDGYSNSWPSDNDFFSIVPDYMNLIIEFGIEYVADKLNDYLSSASRNGSGDDITLALIYRENSLDNRGCTQTSIPWSSAKLAAPTVEKEIQIVADKSSFDNCTEKTCE